MELKIDIDSQALEAFCRKWHIRRLWLFGSVLRDDFRPDSDVDVLYEFDEGKTPGFGILHAEDELANILGRKIDFVPMKYVDWKIKKHPSFKPVRVYGEG